MVQFTIWVDFKEIESDRRKKGILPSLVGISLLTLLFFLYNLAAEAPAALA